MIKQDSFSAGVVARMFDFLHNRTPWHRRLWGIGSCLGLREVMEYSLVAESMPRPNYRGLDYVRSAHKRQVSVDPGVGGQDIRDAVAAALGSDCKDEKQRLQLGHLADRAENDYLERWSTVLSGSHSEPVERTARLITAHLLDLGFSPDHLYRWLTYHSKKTEEMTVAELVADADRMAGRQPVEYELLVPVGRVPDKASGGGTHWLDAPATKDWLASNGSNDHGERFDGGLIFTITARDPWAAVAVARDRVLRTEARVTVGLPGRSPLIPSRRAWVKGKARAYSLAQPERQVEVHALDRESAIYELGVGVGSERIDDVLVLAALMEEGPSGAVIAGGWSAVEGLLVEAASGPEAADQMAAIVACSFVRAELTSLAFAHERGANDALARQIERATSNRDKALSVEVAIAGGHSLTLDDPSDVAAQERMRLLIGGPHDSLDRVRTYLAGVFRRLFNQRNLVLHQASLRSVGLDVAIRSAPALVGAGLDRIVHAHLASRGAVSADALAARAQVELELVGGDSSRLLADLLE